MDLERVWKHYTTGDRHIVLSYIEGGINWHLGEAEGLVGSIYVNWRETPVPCPVKAAPPGAQPGSCRTRYDNRYSEYDINHDGVVNASDWADDPRVGDANRNGYTDPEDLIAAFSDGIDHDHNSYVNDISGWDFYDDQNDPATVDTAWALGRPDGGPPPRMPAVPGHAREGRGGSAGPDR